MKIVPGVYRNNKGSATVEFALVSVLFVTLMLGIVEFGLMIRSYHTLSNAVYEGARAAAVGGTVSTIQNTVVTAAYGLNMSTSNVTVFRQAGSGSNPDDWVTSLADSGGHNDAASGEMILVLADCDHPMVTRFFYGGAATIPISASSVSRRE